MQISSKGLHFFTQETEGFEDFIQQCNPPLPPDRTEDWVDERRNAGIIHLTADSKSVDFFDQTQDQSVINIDRTKMASLASTLLSDGSNLGKMTLPVGKLR